MQRNTIIFIVVKAVHVSDGLPAHHQELKNWWNWFLCVAQQHTETSSISTTLAVAATKFNKYQMLYVQFLSSNDGRRNRLKHVELWQQ